MGIGTRSPRRCSARTIHFGSIFSTGDWSVGSAPQLTIPVTNWAKTANFHSARSHQAFQLSLGCVQTIQRIDRLIADNWQTSVIDLSHGMFEQFFKVMAEIGFEQEARRRLIEPIVLFITDSARVTSQSYAELRRRLEQTAFEPVHNETASFMFYPRGFSAIVAKMRRCPHSAPVADRARRDRQARIFVQRLHEEPAWRAHRNPYLDRQRLR